MENPCMNFNPPSYPEQVAVLRTRITDEIFFALGMKRQGLLQRMLGRLVWKPADRFGHIAANFENEVRRAGLGAGACRVMQDFGLSVNACGIEQIPPRGPLLILANHPGAYDSVVITSCIPRPDLKLVVSDVPFTRALETASPYFIYVSTDTVERMSALRQAVEHLKQGGAILLFASGEVEPDPAFMPGAAATIQTWSRSIEIMLRKAPETRLQIAIASGVLLPRFVYHPITRIRKMPYHQQKLGELLQILQQLLFPRSVAPIRVRVSFSRPVLAADLAGEELMPSVIQHAREKLAEHLEIFKA
jgi:hypothetical protein